MKIHDDDIGVIEFRRSAGKSSPTEHVMRLHASASLELLLSSFEDFIRGCGYPVRMGTISVDVEANDEPEPADEVDPGGGL